MTSKVVEFFAQIQSCAIQRAGGLLPNIFTIELKRLGLNRHAGVRQRKRP